MVECDRDKSGRTQEGEGRRKACARAVKMRILRLREY